MSTAKDDDFWESKEIQPFCFGNNEVKIMTDDIQSVKPLLSVISQKTLSCILGIDKLQNLHQETAIDQPDITLRKILLNRPYSLEQYKSLSSKTALLDAAILSGDGNAILIIVLFLTKTLKRSLVQRLLVDRPDAVNVYIHYLFIRLQTNEITDILTMLGHSLTAAMKNLHIIIKNTRDPNRLLQKLHNCYKAHFCMLPDCKETMFLESYIKLLEWQITIKHKINGTNEELSLNSSVLESLHYACKHHCNTPNNFVMISPTTFIQDYDISPRLYQKTCLQVKASCNRWDDIDRLLLTKGMLGNIKLQACLLIKDILEILHKYNAPCSVLEKYLKFIDNLDERLDLAKKLCCHTIVIDVFVQQGDRAVLLDYKAKLQSQSEEYFYAESALRLPHVKWKN